MPMAEVERTLEGLNTKCRPVVCVILVEEVLANHFDSTKNQTIVNQMIQAILRCYPYWVDHPLELVFRELVLGEQIKDIGLGTTQAKQLYNALTAPDSVSPDLRAWMDKRYFEKKERLAQREKKQEWFKETVPVELLRPQDLATFVTNGNSFLEMAFSKPSWKQILLGASLGQVWNRDTWHSNSAAQIDAVFAKLDYKTLLKLPFTYSYLLLELLYDFAPITKIGPQKSEKSNLQVLSGKKKKQINNEEDQEYVATALHCDRLLTCDTEMHRMADMFREARKWKGTCILMPPKEADQLERYC